MMECRSGEILEVGPSYIKRVAYTAVVDEIRRLRARPDISMADSLETVAAAHDEADPEIRCRGRESGEAIHSCLDRLITSRRAAVTLFLLGHTVAEISGILGWSRRKVENLVYRGLADLRSCLAEKGIEP
jgi:RNA polymerase sigma-70 factor (ECF subfamily)